MADEQVRSKEAAIVAAYAAGVKVADIEREFGVGRSTIYHFIRRSGGHPSRSPRVDSGAKDAALAGLYELLQLQDRRIEEQNVELAALRATCRRLERQLHKLDGAASKHQNAG
jgi:transposase